MNKKGIFHQEDENTMILSLESELDILGIDEHTYKEDSLLFSFHHSEADEKPSTHSKHHVSSSKALRAMKEENLLLDDSDHDEPLCSGKLKFVTPVKARSSHLRTIKQETDYGEAPTKLDILCGQSRSCAAHSGNKRFQDVLDSYASKYNAVDSKQEKMTLTKEIVASITSSGGRFLKFKDGQWQEISTVAARDKVSHALRTKVASWTKQQQEKAESSLVASAKNKIHGHRRRPSGSRRLRRSLSQCSVRSASSEVATVSFDGSDPSSSLHIEDLLKTQREIFAKLQKEIGAETLEHPLKRSSR